MDPPYNTGARDWKYNNNYVDGNDAWRHSKWRAFMERRLRLAKWLLKPDTGVLIVTIDEPEVHHLGMLLEQTYPEASRQLVTIVINQKGGQGRLSRSEEYATTARRCRATISPACGWSESASGDSSRSASSTRAPWIHRPRRSNWSL
ncbi:MULTISPECIES: hypothetical protein [unclassified Thiocapsa]|uniref:hypothetical protein n=1 Tax=unclassified Thiocapsa TaxID=2641286 RepID=UPI0035B2C5AF